MAPGDQQAQESATKIPPGPAPAVPAGLRLLNPRTVHFYARDWAAFATWCRRIGAAPLPADPVTLAAYLSAESNRLGQGAIERRLAAIADQHRRHGLLAPTQHPTVKAVLRAMRGTASPRREPPPSAALLARMIAGCPGDLAGLRDRALLLLMQATGLGRAALVSLDAETIRTSSTGCDLRLQEAGTWREFRFCRNPDLARCPVHALEDWLRVTDTSFGPVFRKIDRWGTIEHHRLGTDAVRRILARRTPTRTRRSAGSGLAADPADPT